MDCRCVNTVLTVYWSLDSSSSFEFNNNNNNNNNNTLNSTPFNFNKFP